MTMPSAQPSLEPFALPSARFRRWRRVLLSLAGVLCLISLANIWLGEAGVAQVVTPQKVFQILGGHTPLLSRFVEPLPPGQEFIEGIVWTNRLPRACCAALVGMLLAMAGVAFQSFLMNPLADPYMTGVSAGAALGAVLVILLGGTALLAGYAQPLIAFGTGLLATGIVYFLAHRAGRLSSQTFLLAGIVVGTFLWSLIPLLLSLANRSGRFDRQSAILSILLGDLQSLDWAKAGVLAVFSAVGAATLWTGARELNMIAVGEASAATAGVNVEGFKRRVILAGTLATAAAVSVAGIIGFVGLVVPHIARRLVGADHRILLPAAMLLGGVFLVGADLLSRVYLQQLEVGVVTSLLGAPVFCYLLRRRLTSG